MSDQPKRFVLRWDGANAAYKVSAPGIDTHEVIFASEFDRVQAEAERYRSALDQAKELAHHCIPQYAYGDNEAGCDLAHRLAKIDSLIAKALHSTQPAEGE